MSICACQPLTAGTPEWDTCVEMEKQILNDPTWSLLSLIDLATTGSSLEAIQSSVPFRRHHCRRSMKCCGMCTRQCRTRCIQDSLHRLYIWRKVVEATPSTELEQLPLGVRLIVKQKFDSAEELSWAVGEIISRLHNPEVQQYMETHGLLHVENPNKKDYSPQPAIDVRTGKRIVNKIDGTIKFRLWPESGLCPYCLPNNEIDRRVHGSSSDESSSETAISWRL